jgi:hypothetical protein
LLIELTLRIDLLNFSPCGSSDFVAKKGGGIPSEPQGSLVRQVSVVLGVVFGARGVLAVAAARGSGANQPAPRRSTGHRAGFAPLTDRVFRGSETFPPRLRRKRK